MGPINQCLLNRLVNSREHIGFQPSLCGKAECFDGFLAGAEEIGGAEISEFGGDEP